MEVSFISTWKRAHVILVSILLFLLLLGFLIVADTVYSVDGTVTGYVYIEGVPTPLANANVTLQDVITYQQWQTTSDALGAFTITAPPGNYYVWAQAPNYARRFYNDAGHTTESAATVTVPNGGNVSGIAFHLNPDATISGRITDANGNPIVNLNVDLDTGGFGTCTNTNGEYTLTNLPRNVMLFVTAGGFNNFCSGGSKNYVREYWNNKLSRNQADALTATDTVYDFINVNFQLEVGGSISGKVTDTQGAPIANMRVQTGYGNEGDSTCTAADGTYILSAIPFNTPFKVNSGFHRVPELFPCGWDYYAQEYWQETSDFNAATQLTLTSGTPTRSNINFTLSHSGLVSGLVNLPDGNTPLSSGGITIRDAGSNAWVAGTGVDSDGHYSILVPAGNYRVSAYPSSGYSQQAWNNKGPSDNFNGDVLTVAAGNTYPNINFTVQPGGNVTGRVTDATTGQGIANLVVDFNSDDGYGIGTCTDSNGNYTFDFRLPLGTPFRVKTGGARGGNNWCGGPINYMEQFWQNTTDWGQATVFTLTQGNSTRANINFALQRGVVISGKVTEVDGTTPVNGQGGVNANEPVNNQWRAGTGLQSDGTYAFTVPPGNYRFVANFDGYIEEQYNNKGPNWQNGDVINAVLGNDLTINFTLDKGGWIYGQVTDQTNGLPIAQMPVSADFEGWGTGACTDANGYYIMQGKIPLNTPFRIHSGGQWNWCGGATNYIEERWEEVQFHHEATVLTIPSVSVPLTDINFTLEVGGSVSGRITDANGPVANANVNVVDFDGSGGNSAVTDSNGNYTVNGLPTGDYHVYAQDANHRMTWWTSTGTTGNPGESSPVHVNVGQNTPNINLLLEPGGSISGRVVDINGNPIVDTRVVAYDVPYGATCTQSDGTYTLTGMPLDTPVVLFSAGPFGHCGPGEALHALKYYRNTYTLEEATPIILTDGNNHQNGINFVLEVGATFSGQITDQNTGLGIPNAYVEISLSDTQWWVRYSINADSSGHFKFTGLPPDTYIVRAVAPGYAREYYNGAQGVPQIWLAWLIPANLGSEFNTINIPLGLGGSITGRVIDEKTGQPVANMFADAVMFSSDCTDQNGYFTIDNLPRGVSLELATGGVNYCENGPTQYQREWYNDVDNIEDATLVVLTDSVPNVSDINFSVIVPQAGTSPTALVIQSGLNTIPVKPTYGWMHIGDEENQTKVPGAWYHLVVQHGEVTLVDKWYPAQTICGAMYCSVNPDQELFLEGEYMWFVEAWAESTGVMTSESATFNLDFDPPDVPSNVKVDVSTGLVVLNWDDDPNASWFFVTVKDAEGNVLYEGWYSREEVRCNGETCELTTEIFLENGDYDVTIQAWGVGGFNGGDPGAFSPPTDFELTFAPAAPPSDFAVTHTETGSPTFFWKPSIGATWHLFYIGANIGTEEAPQYKAYYVRWFNLVEAGCIPGQMCETWLKDVYLPVGTFELWTIAWGPGGFDLTQGINGWIKAIEFSVYADTPGTAQGSMPTGIIENQMPSFTWNQVKGITWYNFWVGKYSGNLWSTEHFNWYRAADICNKGTGVCTVAVDTLYLSEGNYEWYLETYNPAGIGQWSQKQSFTITLP